LPYQWAAAYALFALTNLVLSKTKAFRESPAVAH
jgi:hypothetical protein